MTFIKSVFLSFNLSFFLTSYSILIKIMSKEQQQQQQQAYSQSEDIFNLMSTTPKPISGNLRVISINIIKYH